MVPADPAAGGTACAEARIDPDLAQWATLTAGGAEQEAAPARLHELLVRIARRVHADAAGGCHSQAPS